MKLPPGRLYSSGKAFIPNIRRDLVDKLQAALATPGDESKTHKPAAPPEGQSDEPTVRTVSPITSGLPRSWDSIGVGQFCLIEESAVDGWWPVTVLERDGEILTLRFRDTAATWLMQRGVDPWEAAGFLGMSVKVLIDTYGHHHPNHMRGAANAITSKGRTPSVLRTQSADRLRTG
jgi:hypothetical protein